MQPLLVETVLHRRIIILNGLHRLGMITLSWNNNSSIARTIRFNLDNRPWNAPRLKTFWLRFDEVTTGKGTIGNDDGKSQWKIMKSQMEKSNGK